MQPGFPMSITSKTIEVALQQSNVVFETLLIQGYSERNKKNDPRTVRPYDETQIFPREAERLTVRSTSNSDSATGSGARTLTIRGLNEKWESVTERVVLNGRSAAMTTTKFIRVNTANVCRVGVYGGTNEGDIEVTHSEGMIMFIPAGDAYSSQACYSVPRGFTLLVTAMSATFSNGTKEKLEVWSRLRGDCSDGNNTPFGRVLTGYYRRENGGLFTFPAYMVIPEMTDIDIRLTPGGNNKPASVRIQALLTDRTTTPTILGQIIP